MSNNHNLVAYTLDTKGNEVYDAFIKNLTTNQQVYILIKKKILFY